MAQSYKTTGGNKECYPIMLGWEVVGWRGGGLELPLSTYIYELVKRGGGERAERFRMTEELIFAKF